jgi:hypothetical protein
VNFNDLIDKTMKKTDDLISSDRIMLEQLLNEDKKFPYILRDYFFSNEKFDFSLINDTENCFFKINLFSFEKKSYGIEKDLFGRWDFNSSLYHNINYMLMDADYRIEVTRKEERVENKDILKDLRGLGLKDEIVIDLEFFEFSQWERQYDISQKIKTVDFYKFNHSDFRDYLKENLLHVEKEKIHLKIIKCKTRDGREIYLPLYIGLGTNEPFGLAIKNKDSKHRWYKLSLDDKKPYLEEGKISVVSTDESVILKTLSGCDNLILNDNSWDSRTKTVIATAINSNCENERERDNGLLRGFVRFSYFEKDRELVLGKPISQINPYYDKKEVVRLDMWKEYLGDKDLFQELDFLLSKSQMEYERFFELYNCPYKIVSELGTEKTVELISAKFKKILSTQDFLRLLNCVKWGNVNVIAGDLYKLGADSTRNRISSLLVQLLLSTGRFKKHVDGHLT